MEAQQRLHFGAKLKQRNMRISVRCGMAGERARNSVQKSRELRRRVMLRARMRTQSGWRDACILNVSSHGLLINAPAAAAGPGSSVELWHGEDLIVATVVWRRGSRAGLCTEDRLPMEEILAVSRAAPFHFAAPSSQRGDRPKGVSTHDEGRLRARRIEFCGVAFVGLLLAAGAFIMMEQAFAKPLAYVEAAFGR